MTKATITTLESYRNKIKFGTERTMPMIPGENIKALVKEYKIPVIRWGYSGSLIGIETKKQIIIWRDKGSHLEFKGLINKEVKNG